MLVATLMSAVAESDEIHPAYGYYNLNIIFSVGPLVMGASFATLFVTGGYYAAAGLAAVVFVVAIAAIR
jgi:hypothetical protein